MGFSNKFTISFCVTRARNIAEDGGAVVYRFARTSRRILYLYSYYCHLPSQRTAYRTCTRAQQNRIILYKITTSHYYERPLCMRAAKLSATLIYAHRHVVILYPTVYSLYISMYYIMERVERLMLP